MLHFTMGGGISSKQDPVNKDETQYQRTLREFNQIAKSSNLDERRRDILWMQEQVLFLTTCKGYDDESTFSELTQKLPKRVQQFKNSVQQCFLDSKDTLLTHFAAPLVTVILQYAFLADEMSAFGGTPSPIIADSPRVVVESDSSEQIGMQ